MKLTSRRGESSGGRQGNNKLAVVLGLVGLKSAVSGQF